MKNSENSLMEEKQDYIIQIYNLKNEIIRKTILEDSDDFFGSDLIILDSLNLNIVINICIYIEEFYYDLIINSLKICGISNNAISEFKRREKKNKPSIKDSKWKSEYINYKGEKYLGINIFFKIWYYHTMDEKQENLRFNLNILTEFYEYRNSLAHSVASSRIQTFKVSFKKIKEIFEIMESVKMEMKKVSKLIFDLNN